MSGSMTGVADKTSFISCPRHDDTLILRGKYMLLSPCFRTTEITMSLSYMMIVS